MVNFIIFNFYIIITKLKNNKKLTVLFRIIKNTNKNQWLGKRNIYATSLFNKIDFVLISKNKKYF